MVKTENQDVTETDVTITRTTFADNHADAPWGDDILVWRDGDNQGAVPCPTPGKVCDKHGRTTSCCFDDHYESLTVTLPSN